MQGYASSKLVDFDHFSERKRGFHMAKQVISTIRAQGYEISLQSAPDQDDYISLTDIARFRQPETPGYVIQNWMRNRNTVEYLGLWEQLSNPDFNCLEFEAIKQNAGLNSFVLTPKQWVGKTHAIGIRTVQGRYAATFAHTDIAFEFASWISPEFKLYIIKDYQRLKGDETHRLKLEWTAKRELSRMNYRIHTDAIKDHLIPAGLSAQQMGFVYANEADMLNVVLFGATASQWRADNPQLSGNMRDYANTAQLLVLSNLESLNSVYIRDGMTQPERMKRLRETAVTQLRIILNDPAVPKIEESMRLALGEGKL